MATANKSKSKVFKNVFLLTGLCVGLIMANRVSQYQNSVDIISSMSSQDLGAAAVLKRQQSYQTAIYNPVVAPADLALVQRADLEEIGQKALVTVLAQFEKQSGLLNMGREPECRIGLQELKKSREIKQKRVASAINWKSLNRTLEQNKGLIFENAKNRETKVINMAGEVSIDCLVDKKMTNALSLVVKHSFAQHLIETKPHSGLVDDEKIYFSTLQEKSMQVEVVALSSEMQAYPLFIDESHKQQMMLALSEQGVLMGMDIAVIDIDGKERAFSVLDQPENTDAVAAMK